MSQSTTVVGLDVHKDSIVASILPSGADRASKAITFENRPATLKCFIQRLGHPRPRVFVYEAGPCGYVVQRELVAQGERVVVIAPALIPVRPGDRVKTDRRDAEKLARLYRAGELTAIRVPTRTEEAARDLVRIREDLLMDHLRARHRLSKFLLRHGRCYQETKAWSVRHRRLSGGRWSPRPNWRKQCAYLATCRRRASVGRSSRDHGRSTGDRTQRRSHHYGSGATARRVCQAGQTNLPSRICRARCRRLSAGFPRAVPCRRRSSYRCDRGNQTWAETVALHKYPLAVCEG